MEITGVHVVTAVRDRGIIATECITIVIAIAMTGVIVATITGVTDRPMTDTADTMMADAGHETMMTIATAAMTLHVMHAIEMMPKTASIMADGTHGVATAEIRATGATATATAPVHLTATLFIFGRAKPTAIAAEHEHRKI